MADRFDPNIPGLIQGDVTGITVLDPAQTFPPFEVGNLVVDPSKAFDIKVDWEVSDFLAPLWVTVGANWNVRVYAESVGPGQEIEIGNVLVPVANSIVCSVNPPPAVCKGYTATVTVAANTLQENSATDSGIYKLVTCVFLDSNLGAPGFDMTGFREGPIIKAEVPI